MYKSYIVKSSKFSEIAGTLANLKGIVSVQEIVDTILQIPSISDKLVPSLQSVPEYRGTDGEDLSNIYVDMTYQRRIRLAKLIKKLRDNGGYDRQGAGAIDIAKRKDRKWYVWDGLRRAIMAGIAQVDYLQVSKTIHSSKMTVTDMQIEEARLMDMRNSKVEGMKSEELFKSRVVQKVPKAMRLRDLLINCELDVENIIGKGITLGGFAELENNFETGHNLSNSNLITSSLLIQETFKDINNVSVFLFCGMAYLMQFMDDPLKVGIDESIITADDIDKIYDEEEIREALQSWYCKKGDDGKIINRNQKDLIQPRVNGKTCQSVAWNIVTKVLNDDNGLKVALGKVLGNESVEQLISSGEDND